MPDEKDCQEPSGNADRQPPPPPPVESTVEQRIVALERKSHTHAEQEDSTKEMKREFRLVEIFTIATNVILAIVGILALHAYYGQLGAMQGQLQQMQRDSRASSQQFQVQLEHYDAGLGVNEVQIGKLDASIEQAKRLATNSGIQAKANQASAAAAKSAAETASEALHISERAYLVMGAPLLDLDSLVVSIPILNVGHIPSGAVQITAYEATLEASSGEPSRKLDPLEAKTMPFAHRSIGPSQSSPQESINIPLPKVVAQKFVGNKQQIIIAGSITYNNGFANDPTQTELFCSAGLYFADLKKVSWAGCDPTQYIAEIAAAEAKLKK